MAEHTLQDTTLHDRWLAEQLSDPDFRAENERERRELAVIDEIVNALDQLRAEYGMSKAELAREIGKNPASVRRLLTASGNPELRTERGFSAPRIVVINGMVKPNASLFTDGGYAKHVRRLGDRYLATLPRPIAT